ncbi:MAG TPA: hypothetical protein VFJ29_01400 [Candidatus Kapabacteria bacterium]|nr:hypothetical protein [Candidatus Kapabacteria bacterium]
MNFLHILLAAVVAFVAYMGLGGIFFAALPTMRNEFMKYPAVYRDQAGIKKVMPIGMIFMFISMLALSIIYAMVYREGYGIAEGAHFGGLIGIFVVGAFVVHNYVNLKIGGKLTVQQSIAYFLEWLVVGIVISLIYKP